ncbi:cytidylyltransferase domain-containing protein [Solimicrobium silvestre]|uniref:CMP-N-acetylneuraminic acid synthetase n=1 Tax=Solimicrobium silvestre TaxID=2099400 RepID=A0A2S9GUU5_9BURK|nr:acylneuraminate cytidylyltransferase family protein [Solimicrobium silvestre]PRC91484.1 CMP-N-acetylneuraminic acid synthetase [Solimicrobium silvestre]
MKTLALILARGGSKGIPRKNIRLLAGKPLIAWSIQAALNCPQIDSVVVSTDDEEIAQISRTWGAQVPFMRPAELALDSSPSMDAILHALDQLPWFDTILVLQPTSPLRTTADIIACLNFAFTQQANAVVSVCEPANSPYWMYKLGADCRLSKLMDTNDISRRQDLPDVYALNGALYFAQTSWLRRTQSFLTHETVGFVMPADKSIDIDTPLDWKIAELLLSESS